MRSLELAVKYLAGERLIGTAAERAALSDNLINGTIFEESDTGKHYMFDGTSTWNEIT